MASVNNWNGIGRLVADPESKQTNRDSITNFTIAVDRFSNGGEKKADFFRCVAFGKTAEFVSTYLSKGNLVYVSGRVQIDNVEKDGVRNTYVSIPVNTVQNLSPKSESGNGSADPGRQTRRPPVTEDYGDEDEDPFA